jgi:hypothetical protein
MIQFELTPYQIYPVVTVIKHSHTALNLRLLNGKSYYTRSVRVRDDMRVAYIRSLPKMWNMIEVQSVYNESKEFMGFVVYTGVCTFSLLPNVVVKKYVDENDDECDDMYDAIVYAPITQEEEMAMLYYIMDVFMEHQINMNVYHDYFAVNKLITNNKFLLVKPY